ncbi:MAG: DUF1403 family protein [Boseongicola sp. SB0673_bin_14]|nr:DUF1403 family protein [Boseongicola sp. SB0667_bin_21]MYI69053.1 DUF1403 family protein [Boseongicola sp. SB0673_bin_14]
MEDRSRPGHGLSGSLPSLPAWAAVERAQTVEGASFLAGATLTVLDGLLSDPAHGVPLELLASRLALAAAAATSKLEGRRAREEDIRDAYRLAPPGCPRGPDGDLLAFWRDAAGIRTAGPHWRAGVAELVGRNLEDEAVGWIDAGLDRAGIHGPLAGCMSAMAAALSADSRAERAACILSDAVLARALGWRSLLPVSALRLSKARLRDLAAGRRDAEPAVHAALLFSLQDAVALARHLSRRAAALNAVAPKLRARGASAAIELLLREDAVAPSTDLSPVVRGTATAMTGRAARRLCDRLVGLGVIRELTGRATFRLYGIAP